MTLRKPAGLSIIAICCMLAAYGCDDKRRTSARDDDDDDDGFDITTSGATTTVASGSSGSVGAGGGGVGGQGSQVSASSTSGSGSTSSSSTSSSTSSSSVSSSSASSSGTGGNGPGPGCYDSFACDPLAPNDCDAASGAGSACDFSGSGALTCYSAPNEVALGGACDPSNGPFCAHGMTCAGNDNTTCVEFCCEQSDCTTGTCQPPAGGSGNAFLCL